MGTTVQYRPRRRKAQTPRAGAEVLRAPTIRSDKPVRQAGPPPTLQPRPAAGPSVHGLSPRTQSTDPADSVSSPQLEGAGTLLNRSLMYRNAVPA